MVEKTTLLTIPVVRQVNYDTFANLPVTGLKIGDLGYATDRKTLYRWNGVAYQPITLYADSGVAANIPAAADLPEGSLYYETDTYLLKQVQSGAWVCITIYSRSGLAADIPAAAGLPEGSFYYETDTYLTKQILSGAWVDITPAKATYTELVGKQNHQVGQNDTWEDWDISGIIPAGAKSALIDIRCNFTLVKSMGVRKNGSALDRNFSIGGTTAVGSHAIVLTEVDANRVIECYGTVSPHHTFSVLGYWS